MKTIQLLFNDDMAHAIVEGRKTMTRRPVTPNASQRWWLKSASRITACPSARMLGPAWPSTAAFEHPGGGPFTCIDAPCAPGDLLIGRECVSFIAHGPKYGCRAKYRADGAERVFDPAPNEDLKYRPIDGWKCIPSIHMPDWAARIRRRVISVTVERLQHVTEEDAVREGMERQPGSDSRYLSPMRGANATHTAHNARQAFRLTWDGIYAAKGLGWDTNPWVWRIEFGSENVEGEK